MVMPFGLMYQVVCITPLLDIWESAQKVGPSVVIYGYPIVGKRFGVVSGGMNSMTISSIEPRRWLLET